MEDDPNQAAPVRDGEQLDAAGLARYLREAMPELDGAVEIQQFPSGHSNLTYLVRAGGEEMVLRRPPFGSRVKTAHDMGREYRVLSKLHPIFPPAPRPLHYCEDPAVLGAPFYLMERRRGLVIRKELPAELESSPALLGRLSESCIENLATMHGLDLDVTGLRELGKPDGYARRQIEGWSRRWGEARTEEIPAMTELARWLAARMPAESGVSLIHNDYKLDNLMLDPNDVTRIVAVLDWEMATIGDPLMDFGTSLSYWVEAGDPPEFLNQRLAPTARPGFLTRREAADHYARVSGRDLSGLVYYYVYGLFKVAVIIQQIYFRYVRGLTHDERFAGFGEMVRALACQAVVAAEHDSVAPVAG